MKVKEQEKQLAKREKSKELQLKLEKLLPFTLEEDEEGGEKEEEVTMHEEKLEREEITTKRKKLGKNPDVDTGFLPDQDRKEQEWEAKQEKIKSEEIEITFNYWAGCGHQQTVKMKKGNTMKQFLQKALEILREDSSKLRSAGVEQFIFCDFIITKVSGKNWPLFNFDLHDDGWILSNATSHAGKVVLRSCNEKNKHIFPAICWEPYDHEKKWDKYKIR
ncbi:FAM50A-containing [Ictidomys tridecemlineatus]|uniref:FAM50A/XAP5 C-terminal domain-containing protein n=1 Tax=Ictidomys tridecemlineatus TaxID=43179 RepID=A0A287D8J2_ICTTR|nr:FAM50A-containing [Ictidomys tridecemlineatus]